MVKNTNRIHNLNKVISEYKSQLQEFEAIEKEIYNQQKEMEELRLMILQIDLVRQGSSSKNNLSISPSFSNSSFDKMKLFKNQLSSTPKMVNPNKDDNLNKRINENEKLIKEFIESKTKEKLNQINYLNQNEQFNKEKIKNKIQEKPNRKSKEFKNKKIYLRTDPMNNQKANQLNNNHNIHLDGMVSNLNEKSINQTLRINQLNKLKGLKCVSKNILNQNNNRYLDNKLTIKPTDKLMVDKGVKKDNLFVKKLNCNLIQKDQNLDAKLAISKTNELLNKIKSTVTNKFENQENPNEGLGISIISKSINKRTRFTKTSLIKPTKLTASNRALQRL